MKSFSGNFFATGLGVIAVGCLIGIIAPVLQRLGNPGNMGICVACMERDIAGALGFHRAAAVQYLRPEILGFVIGAFIAAIVFREFRPRGGSAPLTRFVLGMVAMIGALVFLGCPWRALLRLAGGDLNAIFGLFGLISGIWIGTLFFKKGYSLGKSSEQGWATGIMGVLIAVGLLLLRFIYPPIEGQAQSGILFYSLQGPGASRAPLFISLGAGLLIGFLAQRSRFCTMGGIRDLILFRQMHLFSGIVSLLFTAWVVNLVMGQFHPGFEKQPIAHSQYLWNFAGMLVAGLAFALAGGCPGRQLFMAGEGDSDAALFVVGMIVGAALAHNFFMASTPQGIGPNGISGVALGLAVCLFVGFTNVKRS